MAGIAKNYSPDQMNPVTFQHRVTINHDFAAVLFETDVIPAGNDAVSAPIDVRADKDRTLFIKTTQNVSVKLQITDDDSANPDFYDMCDTSGNVISFTVNAAQKAIPVSIKAIGMRVLLHNNGAASDTPYVGVM